MNSLMFHTFFLFALIANAYGRIVHFSLITFGQEATVTFNGNTLPLQPVDNFSGVRGASAICPDEEFEYTYTLNGKAEGFTRKLPAGELTTHNEFFGRKETVSPLKGMGYPIDKPQWTRSIGKTEVFDDSYIPTVILDDGSRDFFITGNDTWVLGRFTLVLKDEIFTEENVPTKAQNRYHDKFQWRVKLEKKIHKRKVFKFRSNSADPTFFRQSLYADMVAAVGNPVHNQVIVRAYLSDGTPIGLYLMIEVTSSKSFIKSQFYGNEETGKITAPQQLGFPLDCSTGADFRIGSTFSAFQYSKGENNEKIKFLTDAMHKVDVKNEASVKKFSKEWFDLDVFFRALALEYLTGNWDSYWMLTTNFVMYDDPEESTKNTFKYYFIDQDFDLTFGLNILENINTWGVKFPYQSYKTLVNRKWNIDQYDGPNREAIDLFLRGGVTTQMFENHLIDIVKHVFNPVAAGRRINEYVRRYSSEVEWDYGLERLHIHNNPNKTTYTWNMVDFRENLEKTPKENTPWGLKQWISMRANAVANEFKFEWDQVPLDPVEKIISLKNEENTANLVNSNSESDGAISNNMTSIAFTVMILVTIALLL